MLRNKVTSSLGRIKRTDLAGGLFVLSVGTLAYSKIIAIVLFVGLAVFLSIKDKAKKPYNL